MKTFIGFALALWLGLAGRVVAQSPEVLEFLQDAFQVESSDALAEILVAKPEFADTTAIWREAVTIGRTDLAEEAAGRAAIVRLMEAAVQRGGGGDDATPLDRPGPADLAALKAAVGFPGDAELLRYLFLRDPSLRDEFEFEEYSIVRVIIPEFGVHVIRERADRPYLGLTPTFSEKFLAPVDDPVPVAPGERARTRHLNLAAIGDIIVAAKAYRAAERVLGAARAYALVVAVDALERAVRANPTDFRLVPYRAQWALLDVLRTVAAGDPFLESERQQREFAVARTAFFARQFSDAAEAYLAAPVPPDDARGRLWSAWGEAVSNFARGADAGHAFDQVAELLTPQALNHARMFRLILRHLGPSEQARLTEGGQWEERLDTLLGADERIASNNDWLAVNQEFLRILETIGRPDIAARYLMAEIDLIDRSGPDAWRESQMLIWLAPFMRDLCGVVSFEMSVASGWQLRHVTGYNRYLDFLHSVDSDGNFVRPGQVVLVLDEPGPYGATSPEEDRATVVAVYGVSGTDLFDLAAETPSANKGAAVAGVEGWVRDALGRTEPVPSAAPYLKLIWIEWFSQAFEPLKTPSMRAPQYRYKPLEASKLTSQEAVQELLEHPAIRQHDREMLELFLTTRRFLERRYP